MNVWFVSVSEKLCFGKYLVSFVCKGECRLIAYHIEDLSVQSFSWALVELCRDTNQSIFNPIFYGKKFYGTEVFLPINYRIVVKENDSYPELESPWLERIVDLEKSVEEIRSNQNLDPNIFMAKLEEMLREKFP